MGSEGSLTRRELLAGAAVLGAAAACGGTIVVATTGVASADGTQFGFSMNVDHCVGCEKCVQACRYYNHLADDVPDRRRVMSLEENELKTRYLSTSCMHCADPSCATVCPARAITKGEAGIVKVDKDRCIGCKYCYQACPFSVPHYASTGMDKCDCCTTAGVAPGDPVYCARACMFDALNYGPLDELLAQAGEQGQVLQASTVPSCVLVKG